jgi:hypothetical protein
VCSSLISLPAVIPRVHLMTCGFVAQSFPSFLDVSRSFAGRMRDELAEHLSPSDNVKLEDSYVRREPWGEDVHGMRPGVPHDQVK